MSDAEDPLHTLLRKNYSYLVEKLNASYYLDDLWSAEFLADEDRDQVTGERNRRNQAKAFLDILAFKSEECIQEFLGLVRTQKDKQPYIYYKLFPRAKQPGSGRQITRQRECFIDSANSGSEEACGSSVFLRGPRGEVGPPLSDIAAELRPTLLLDHLRSFDLLTDAEYAQLQQEQRTEVERSRTLLNKMLSQGLVAKFCDVLRIVDGQGHVAEILQATVTFATEKPASVAARYLDTHSSHALPSLSVAVTDATRMQEHIGKQGQGDMAVFFFEPQCLELVLVSPAENSIQSMCVEFFRMEPMLVSAATTDMKRLKYPCYMDIHPKLAVLLLSNHDVQQGQAGYGYSTQELKQVFVTQLQKVKLRLELPRGDCTVLEIFSNSSYAVLQLGISQCISLLCVLGDSAMRKELSRELHKVFSKSKKAELRLGGLPSLELFNDSTGTTPQEQRGKSGSVSETEKGVGDTQPSQLVETTHTDETRCQDIARSLREFYAGNTAHGETGSFLDSVPSEMEELLPSDLQELQHARSISKSSVSHVSGRQRSQYRQCQRLPLVAEQGSHLSHVASKVTGGAAALTGHQPLPPFSSRHRLVDRDSSRHSVSTPLTSGFQSRSTLHELPADGISESSASSNPRRRFLQSDHTQGIKAVPSSSIGIPARVASRDSSFLVMDTNSQSQSMPLVERSPEALQTWKKITLVQDFAFHFFFMVTRMPYQVLGAQCNDLNREYAAGGITSLLQLIAQIIEKAASDLGLWSEEETGSNSMKSRYQQIKKEVQRSLEGVGSMDMLVNVGGQQYSQIQWEADQLTRDVRVRFQLEDPHILMIFDFHRKVALLNSRWSAEFYKFGIELNPMEARIFREEAQEFVVMTHSVPNIFTPLYMDAIQAARYHCSRFQPGLHRDRKEFGLQLSFIRFLSDHMRYNLEEPTQGIVQLERLTVPQDAFYKDNIVQFHEAGVPRIEDLDAENRFSVEYLYAEKFRVESPYKETGDNEQFQMAMEVSKQQAQIVGGGKSSFSDGFDDLDLAVAEFLSLEEARTQLKVKQPATGSPAGPVLTEQGNAASPSVFPGNFDDGIIQSGVQANGPSVKKQVKEAGTEGQFRVPDELTTLFGSAQGCIYHRFCIEDSKVEARFLRVDIVGRDRVGKTSLARSLVSEAFCSDLSSTEGLDSLQIEVFEMSNWQRCRQGFGLDTLGDHIVASSVAHKFKELKRSQSSSHAQTTDSAIAMSGEYSYMPSRAAVRSHQSQTESIASAAAGRVIDTGSSPDLLRTSSLNVEEIPVLDVRPQTHSEIPAFMKKLICQYYSGALSLDVSPDQLYLAVFDYGGHAVYSPSNTPFLSRKGLKLLVFNVAETLDAKCPQSVFVSAERGEAFLAGTTDLTNWDILDDWLSYIYLTSPKELLKIRNPMELLNMRNPKELHVPFVSLVATHKDEAEQTHGQRIDKWLTSQSDYIVNRLENKKVLQHILPGDEQRKYMFTCVDNTRSGEHVQDKCDQGVLWLKKLIQTVAHKICLPVPVRWLMIGKVVKDLKDDGKVVVVHRELRLATAELRLIRDDKDFADALQFLSDQGLLVTQYLQWCGTRQPVVITDLRWLAVSFCRILTVHGRNRLGSSFACDYNTLETKGIMTETLADRLLDICPEEHRKVVLESMMAYDLICLHTQGARPCASEQTSSRSLNRDADDRCRAHDSDDSDASDDDADVDGPQHFKNTVYIVPSILKPRHQRTVPESFDCPGEIITSLWFRLPEGHYPSQVIHRILLQLVRKYPRTPQIFYHEGLFNVRRGHMLRLLVEGRYLRMVMHITNTFFSAKRSQRYCDEARRHIQEKFAESRKRDVPRIGDLQRGIMVTLPGSSERSFAIVKMSKSTGQRYLSTDTRQGAPIPDDTHLYLWFNDMKVPDTDEPAARNPFLTKWDLSIEKLLDEEERQTEGRALRWVALLLDDETQSGDDWRALYKHLFGSESPDRRTMSDSLRNGPTIATLRSWVQKKGCGATVRNLVCALSAIHRNDAANVFCWSIAHGSVLSMFNTLNYYYK